VAIICTEPGRGTTSAAELSLTRITVTPSPGTWPGSRALGAQAADRDGPSQALAPCQAERRRGRAQLPARSSPGNAGPVLSSPGRSDSLCQ
jgi:hypothetical protein